jgi:hypothetical protein
MTKQSVVLISMLGMLLMLPFAASAQMEGGDNGEGEEAPEITLKFENKCGKDRIIQIGQGPYYTLYKSKKIQVPAQIGDKIYLYQPKKDNKIYATVEESHKGKTLTLCK